jgi:hypothetical protein
MTLREQVGVASRPQSAAAPHSGGDVRGGS